MAITDGSLGTPTDQRHSSLPLLLNKKVKEASLLKRLDLLDKLESEEELESPVKSMLQYYFENSEKSYPAFGRIPIRDFLDLQNILVDISHGTYWSMNQFIKFITKWFIAYYSGETDRLPFRRAKRGFKTKIERRLEKEISKYWDK